MGKKMVGIKGRNIVKDSSEDTPVVSISDEEESRSVNPQLPRTVPKVKSKAKAKAKQPAESSRRKIQPRGSKPRSPTPVSIPQPPLVSPIRSCKPYSLGGRPATPRDLERIRAKYNIPSSVSLRVPRDGECPELPSSDGIALHIDLFDLGLRLPLQPFFSRMFRDMQIAPSQLSLPCWRLLTGLEVLWREVFGEDISYRELRGLYQLKKSAGLSVAYFATWGLHGHLVRPDPLLKKGYKYGWFVAEGEWWRGTPAEEGVAQVRNLFNEDNITWSKATCPIQEVGRKVNDVAEKFRALQSESDVLSTARLMRAGLIDGVPPSSSGGDTRTDAWCSWGTSPSPILGEGYPSI